MNFKTLFNQYIAVLNKFKAELKPLQFNFAELEKIGKTIRQDKHSFSYVFSKFKIVIPKKIKPSHSIPKIIGDITITIIVKDTISIRVPTEEKIEDPLLKLDNFNIILNSGKYNSSWHLDRHIMAENEGEGKHLHPIYHMTFGGHVMESQQQEDEDIYGSSLIVRSPRLMHPPLELILGLDFIFRHFIPKSRLKLLSNPQYNDLVNKIKKLIWLPFSLALAKNYCDNIMVDNKPYTFDKNFVERVIGHD